MEEEKFKTRVKTKILTVLISLYKTLPHLIITLLLSAILVFAISITPQDTKSGNSILNEVLISIVGGVAAVYLIAIYDTIRIGKNTIVEINGQAIIFLETVLYMNIKKDYNYLVLYKIYKNILVLSNKLCYKRTFETLSASISNIVKAVKNKNYSDLETLIEKLSDAIENFK